MNSEEYAKLEALDRLHWFYRGKRAVVRHWIDRYVSLQRDDLLVDGGTGTGTWPVEMSSCCQVVAVDDHEESVQLALPKLTAVGGQVLKCPLDRIDLPDGAATVVTLLDVLEHLDDDQAAVREMIRLMRPNGLLVVTVPAHMWLWSDWDVALHHRRRYTRTSLRRLLEQPELEILHLAHINTLALAPILLVRWWRRLFPPRKDRPRAEDMIPPAFVNRLLYASFVVPACWRWFQPPCGVSLLAVARRRTSRDQGDEHER